MRWPRADADRDQPDPPDQEFSMGLTHGSVFREVASSPRERVLILGAGFIGSAVTRSLLDRGHSVTVLTKSPPAPHRRPLLIGADVVLGEATKMATLATSIAEVDHVIYAVGSSSPLESDLDPASDISSVVPPLVRLLEFMRLRAPVRVTFLSSGGTVYGNPDSLPVPEDAPTRPITSYGILKLACEHYISMYAEVHGVNANIVRIANPYGPGQLWEHSQGIVARLMRSAITAEHTPLYGWGRMIRDYVYIDDVADAIADVVGHPYLPRIMNVGSGVGHTTQEVVDLVQRITERPLVVTTLASRTCDVHEIILDISRIRGCLNFSPRSLATGLKETWARVQEDSPDVPARALRSHVPNALPT